MCKLRYNTNIGCVLLGLCCLYMGSQMLQTGHEFYGPYFHAWRRLLLPSLKNRLTPSWTFDDLAKMVCMIHGVLMCLSGLLIMWGNKNLGPVLLILEMEFMIILVDNPLLTEHLKPQPKSTKYKWDQLTRHISVIGVAVLMMCSPLAKSDDDEEPEKPAKKVKAH
jgi:hypothetical protein